MLFVVVFNNAPRRKKGWSAHTMVENGRGRGEGGTGYPGRAVKKKAHWERRGGAGVAPCSSTRGTSPGEQNIPLAGLAAAAGIFQRKLGVKGGGAARDMFAGLPQSTQVSWRARPRDWKAPKGPKKQSTCTRGARIPRIQIAVRGGEALDQEDPDRYALFHCVRASWKRCTAHW